MSPVYVPPHLIGMTVDVDNPFHFNFIVDSGHSNFEGEDLKEESHKLIRYFLATLTIPEEDLWVNLSPYEKDRIIPDEFGKTEMGRDLLAQDYLLKQLTASLIYPEEELGKEFWDRVYKRADELYGTTEIPVNTFNKVWIVPDVAVIHEHERTVIVVDSHLRVMLEEDYLAAGNNFDSKEIRTDQLTKGGKDVLSSVSSSVIRDVLLPEIEKEVNEGKHFAPLRQIYHSMILATWYKKRLKNSPLNVVYADEKKVVGINIEDEKVNQKIYNQYIEAFKKGVYNYIKEEYDTATQQIVPRKYFSGGFNLASQKFSEGKVKKRKGIGRLFRMHTNFQFLSGHRPGKKQDRRARFLKWIGGIISAGLLLYVGIAPLLTGNSEITYSQFYSSAYQRLFEEPTYDPLRDFSVYGSDEFTTRVYQVLSFVEKRSYEVYKYLWINNIIAETEEFYFLRGDKAANTQFWNGITYIPKHKFRSEYYFKLENFIFTLLHEVGHTWSFYEKLRFDEDPADHFADDMMGILELPNPEKGIKRGSALLPPISPEHPFNNSELLTTDHWNSLPSDLHQSLRDFVDAFRNEIFDVPINAKPYFSWEGDFDPSYDGLIRLNYLYEDGSIEFVKSYHVPDFIEGAIYGDLFAEGAVYLDITGTNELYYYKSGYKVALPTRQVVEREYGYESLTDHFLPDYSRGVTYPAFHPHWPTTIIRPELDSVIPQDLHSSLKSFMHELQGLELDENVYFEFDYSPTFHRLSGLIKTVNIYRYDSDTGTSTLIKSLNYPNSPAEGSIRLEPAKFIGLHGRERLNKDAAYLYGATTQGELYGDRDESFNYAIRVPVRNFHFPSSGPLSEKLRGPKLSKANDLKDAGQVTVIAPIPKLEMNKTSSPVSNDTENNSEVGGIDMNSKWLDLESENEGKEIIFNVDPKQFQNIQIQGITPFIFNVTPLPSLSPLLGLSDQDDQPQLSHLTN